MAAVGMVGTHHGFWGLLMAAVGMVGTHHGLWGLLMAAAGMVGTHHGLWGLLMVAVGMVGTHHGLWGLLMVAVGMVGTYHGLWGLLMVAVGTSRSIPWPPGTTDGCSREWQAHIMAFVDYWCLHIWTLVTIDDCSRECLVHKWFTLVTPWLQQRLLGTYDGPWWQLMVAVGNTWDIWWPHGTIMFMSIFWWFQFVLVDINPQYSLC